MAFVVAGSQPGLDASKCVKLALIHDVAEAIVGDITPHCGVSKAEKSQREAVAMAQLQAMLGTALWRSAGEEMRALWQEYESGESEEARLLKDLDKLEMLLQAHEYETQSAAASGAAGVDLSEFFESTEGKFKTPAGLALEAEVRERRSHARAAEAASSAR
jgi:putative hydrolase of HD superfamily